MSAAAPADLGRFVELAQERVRRQQAPLTAYRPYRKQVDFHSKGATFRERLLRAGNQNGKTFAGAMEMTFHLTGRYPEWWDGRRFDYPVLAWASGDTGEATRDNAQRALFGVVGSWGTGTVPAWLIGEDRPAAGTAELRDYVKVRHVSGGWSTVRFKYYAQGRKKWQGPPVDVVWFDEEPPPDIYAEGLARTIATKGLAYLTFTPLLGMSEVVRMFLMAQSPDRADTNMTIEDAEHIPAEERARIIASFPEHEREARSRGVPSLGSGRIFPFAEAAVAIPAFEIPAFWPVLGALDFGWDHPTAAVRLAWDRDADRVYVTHAYRESNATPVTHAAALRAWGENLPWAWPHDGMQTEKGSGVQLAEQYRRQGLAMLAEHARYPETRDDTRASRTSVEAGVADLHDRMLTGRLKVFAHLADWFEEFRLYHRKDGVIVKQFDDLMSATRYGIMMLRFAAAGQGQAITAGNWYR